MSYGEKTLDVIKTEADRIDNAATRLSAQCDAGDLGQLHQRRLESLTRALLDDLRRLRRLAESIEANQ